MTQNHNMPLTEWEIYFCIQQGDDVDIYGQLEQPHNHADLVRSSLRAYVSSLKSYLTVRSWQSLTSPVAVMNLLCVTKKDLAAYISI